MLGNVAQVPADAWSMDMVFTDTGDLHGGFYDNNSGVDYHVPIVGSSIARPPLHIAHVSVEMAPIAKVRCGGSMLNTCATRRGAHGSVEKVIMVLPGLISIISIR